MMIFSWNKFAAEKSTNDWINRWIYKSNKFYFFELSEKFIEKQ